MWTFAARALGQCALPVALFLLLPSANSVSRACSGTRTHERLTIAHHNAHTYDTSSPAMAASAACPFDRELCANFAVSKPNFAEACRFLDESAATPSSHSTDRRAPTLCSCGTSLALTRIAVLGTAVPNCSTQIRRKIDVFARLHLSADVASNSHSTVRRAYLVCVWACNGASQRSAVRGTLVPNETQR